MKAGPERGPKRDPLQVIPGVGPSVALALRELGYADVPDLVGEDPETMYSRLNQLRGERQDPCVLYIFRCVVYFASAEEPDPELLKWWAWKDLSLREVEASNGSMVRKGRN